MDKAWQQKNSINQGPGNLETVHRRKHSLVSSIFNGQKQHKNAKLWKQSSGKGSRRHEIKIICLIREDFFGTFDLINFMKVQSWRRGWKKQTGNRNKINQYLVDSGGEQLLETAVCCQTSLTRSKAHWK